MIEIITIILICTIGLALFFGGLFLNDKGVYISGFGAALFIILGISLLINPLQIEVGENVTYVYGDNYTSYHWDYTYSNPSSHSEINLFHATKTNIYQDMDSTLNYVLSMVFILLGLAGVLYAGYEYNEAKYSK